MKLSNSELFYKYDKRGVRAFVRYSELTGKYSIECYRKKRKDESKGDNDWKMTREGNIESYFTRKQAEVSVLKLAKQICKDNGF